MEVIGIRGAPRLTLPALLNALKQVNLSEATVYFLTDWQDRRAKARFAVLVRDGTESILSLDAFGPKFGAGGSKALQELTLWLIEQGVRDFKEAVIAPSEFAALFELDGNEASKLIGASANPTDPALYVQDARNYAP
jgi:hypothetical protein